MHIPFQLQSEVAALRLAPNTSWLYVNMYTNCVRSLRLYPFTVQLKNLSQAQMESYNQASFTLHDQLQSPSYETWGGTFHPQ